jgi:hypothetical protein
MQASVVYCGSGTGAMQSLFDILLATFLTQFKLVLAPS